MASEQETAKKLDEHIKEYNEKIKEMDDRLTRILESQEKCIKSLENLADEASGVIRLYNDTQTAITLGITAQRFGVWVVKWPVIGVGIHTMYQWIKSQVQ